mmetsp:Transcript_92677/g.181572  ORF Transcript_92677/g.181572 Transcript_92677/m.181572 type:complete len:206 (-) Transcript_92677:416-1033(-)
MSFNGTPTMEPASWDVRVFVKFLSPLPWPGSCMCGGDCLWLLASCNSFSSAKRSWLSNSFSSLVLSSMSSKSCNSASFIVNSSPNMSCSLISSASQCGFRAWNCASFKRKSSSKTPSSIGDFGSDMSSSNSRSLLRMSSTNNWSSCCSRFRCAANSSTNSRSCNLCLDGSKPCFTCFRSSLRSFACIWSSLIRFSLTRLACRAAT